MVVGIEDPRHNAICDRMLDILQDLVESELIDSEYGDCVFCGADRSHGRTGAPIQGHTKYCLWKRAADLVGRSVIPAVVPEWATYFSQVKVDVVCAGCGLIRPTLHLSVHDVLVHLCRPCHEVRSGR